MKLSVIFCVFICFSFVLFLESCCNEHDENSGIIISILNFDNVNYSWLNMPDTCCIREDSEYRKLVTNESLRNDMPNVDFSKNSVLINQKQTNGRIFCNRKVLVDSVNKVVTYYVSVSKCFCPDKCNNSDYNIVLVPKISRNYKIEYK